MSLRASSREFCCGVARRHIVVYAPLLFSECVNNIGDGFVYVPMV